MLGRLSAGLVIALVSINSVAVQDASASDTKKIQTSTKQTAAKKTAKHSVRRIAHRGKGSYLVPPPPPYAPSILPELAYARARGHRKTTASVRESNQVVDDKTYHEKVGVQAADGYEDPEPVKQNKYVTYWNKS